MRNAFFVLLIAGLSLSLAACGSKEGKEDKHDMSSTEHKMDGDQEMAPKNNLAVHKHDSTSELHADKLYACPMNAEYITSDPDASCPKCEMYVKPIAEVKPDFDAKSAELYTCSMHPEFVTSEAGDQCPICEMNVTKVE